MKFVYSKQTTTYMHARVIDRGNSSHSCPTILLLPHPLWPHLTHPSATDTAQPPEVSASLSISCSVHGHLLAEIITYISNHTYISLINAHLRSYKLRTKPIDVHVVVVDYINNNYTQTLTVLSLY